MSISAAHAGQYDLGRVSSPKTSYPKATQRLSLFSLELPSPPMRVFPARVEHALDVPVQCPHDADPREHRRAAERRDQHQGFPKSPQGIPPFALIASNHRAP
jgi:hypothetical protein